MKDARRCRKWICADVEMDSMPNAIRRQKNVPCYVRPTRQSKFHSAFNQRNGWADGLTDGRTSGMAGGLLDRPAGGRLCVDHNPARYRSNKQMLQSFEGKWPQRNDNPQPHYTSTTPQTPIMEHVSSDNSCLHAIHSVYGTLGKFVYIYIYIYIYIYVYISPVSVWRE